MEAGRLGELCGTLSLTDILAYGVPRCSYHQHSEDFVYDPITYQLRKPIMWMKVSIVTHLPDSGFPGDPVSVNPYGSWMVCSFPQNIHENVICLLTFLDVQLAIWCSFCFLEKEVVQIRNMDRVKIFCCTHDVTSLTDELTAVRWKWSNLERHTHFPDQLFPFGTFLWPLGLPSITSDLEFRGTLPSFLSHQEVFISEKRYNLEVMKLLNGENTGMKSNICSMGTACGHVFRLVVQ